MTKQRNDEVMRSEARHFYLNHVVNTSQKNKTPSLRLVADVDIARWIEANCPGAWPCKSRARGSAVVPGYLGNAIDFRHLITQICQSVFRLKKCRSSAYTRQRPADGFLRLSIITGKSLPL